MTVTRFTTTRLSGLYAAGRSGSLQHAVITAFLAKRLGPEYANIFADFEVPDSDSRDWFVDGITMPVSWRDLPSAEKNGLSQRCAERFKRILQLADKIENESLEMRHMAQRLRDVTSFPSEAEDLWSLDGEPIITNWGYYREDEEPGPPLPIRVQIKLFDPQPEKAAETKIDEAPAAPPVEPLPKKPKRNLRWLLPLFLWLVFIGLMGAIYQILLPACGVRETWGLNKILFLDHCPKAATVDEAFAQGRRLEREVEQAEIAVARFQQDCALENARVRSRQAAATEPPPTPQQQQEAQTNQDVDQRLQQNDAGRGRAEISLVWNNRADLDLWIICPTGKLGRPPYKHGCGGEMIKDINIQGDRADPIEHAFWQGDPPHGRYKIQVELYSYNSEPEGSEIPFTIRIKRDNDIQQIQGQIRGKGRILPVHEITF